MAICEFCGKEHNGSYGTGRFCNRSCRSKWAGQKTKESFEKNFVYIPKIETRICKKCGKEFTVDVKKENKKKPKRFCCRSCANSHVIKEETKQKIRQTINKSILKKGLNLRQRDKNGIRLQKLVKPKLLVCEICGKEFKYYRYGKRHTCYNATCKSKYLSLKMKQNPNVGGYRSNSGNGNGGWYKGIACQSSYELAWVIYNLDHNIKFQKCKKVFYYELNGQQHKYFPDFELENGTIIEIKGYYQTSVSLKEEAVLKEGYKYKIFYKKDLKYCFDYVKEKYNVSKENIITLYDESKGYIEKTCIICGKKFKTRNKNQQCCSRSCNGKYVQKKRFVV